MYSSNVAGHADKQHWLDNALELVVDVSEECSRSTKEKCENKVDFFKWDQTFAYLYPEEQAVVAQKVTKRVGGKFKYDTKVGFTYM